MDYKEKYEQAMNRAKAMIKVANNQEETYNIVITIFQELKESEDERIRKQIIAFATGAIKGEYSFIPYQFDKWITWLEKQGEKKSEVKYVYTKFRIGDVIVEIKPNGYCPPVRVKYIGEGAYSCESDDGKRSLSFPITNQDKYKLVEQKHDDKVEPKFKVGDTMITLQEAADGYTDGMPVVVSIDNEYYHCTNELIAIKDQDGYEFPPINMKQKPTDKVEPKFKVKYAGSEYNVFEIKEIAGVTYYGIEDEPNHIDYVLPDNCKIVSEHNPAWSEEDDYNLQCMIAKVASDIQKGNVGRNNELIDWLKSLRPQSRWKPSEEQMKAFERCLFFLKNNHDEDSEIMSELLKQLKAL